MKKNKLNKMLLSLLAVGVLTVGAIGTINSSALEKNESLTVSFDQPNILELTLSTNTVDFGDINGIAETTFAGDVTATVSSSLPWDLTVKSDGDLTADNSTIPINKLQIGVDDSYQTASTDEITLVSTYPNCVDQQFALNFKLDKTVGYKAGNYQANLTFKAMQN